LKNNMPQLTPAMVPTRGTPGDKMKGEPANLRPRCTSSTSRSQPDRVMDCASRPAFQRIVSDVFAVTSQELKFRAYLRLELAKLVSDRLLIDPVGNFMVSGFRNH
jgi:hypothetical protein